jgi:ketosteroid isomerase-like protein
MSDFQAIADRVEIEALRGEFTDAVMTRDRARLASLFTPDGALRMPNIPAEMVGRAEIRTGGERLRRRLPGKRHQDPAERCPGSPDERDL